MASPPWARAALVVVAVACAACSGPTARTTDREEPDSAEDSRPSEPRTEVRDDLAEVFEDAEVVGTFVLYEPQAEQMTVVSPDLAAQRALPASTFKIPNSLIALETGAVADVEEVIPYGGEPQRIPDWEADMSMREAMPLSAVPIYQELARRVGEQEMAKRVAELGYGNEDTGDAEDLERFWLTGPLAISAEEQALFLADFARGEVPGDTGNIEQVHTLLVDEEFSGDGAPRLYAKTGWAGDADPQAGWYVGWVEDAEEVAAFALRITIEEPEDADLRRPLAVTLLEALEILPAS